MLMSVVLLPACQSMQTVADSSANHAAKTVLRDSIYQHDSVSVTFHPLSSPSPCGDGRESGYDTLLVERWHTRWRDRNILKTDTLTQTQIRTETVQIRYVPDFYKYCAAFSILSLLYWLFRLVRFLTKRFNLI